MPESLLRFTDTLTDVEDVVDADSCFDGDCKVLAGDLCVIDVALTDDMGVLVVIELLGKNQGYLVIIKTEEY